MEEIYQLTEEMEALNEQPILAEENILDGHVELTGQAGKGKTFLLKDDFVIEPNFLMRNSPI